jgi:hypothetical protein
MPFLLLFHPLSLWISRPRQTWQATEEYLQLEAGAAKEGVLGKLLSSQGRSVVPCDQIKEDKKRRLLDQDALRRRTIATTLLLYTSQ